MKKLTQLCIFFAIILLVFAACTSQPTTPPAPAAVDKPVAAPAETPPPPAPDYTVLDEPVTGASANSLASTIGAVSIVVSQDLSYTDPVAVKGATVELVDFHGKKALRVTKNANSEIRISFLLDKPSSLAGYKTLEFSVAGFAGWEGSYNCGLLYTAAKDTGERTGSFYLGRILKDEWVTVKADLVKDEQWGNNFSEDKTLYCLQFWTNQSKYIYISDLALKK